ncbi:vacuolar amino acid transporter-like protein 1 [Lindgomyces ingoldianus]|uniref:Vacuolar amino acid transporter-like protein 1 n=1 Tax=Lindgomyces ingoldianus TaxID=673940 RepID=A0ACB6R6E6_9PLEO|nr:vacuolar amino acid transporter-like protein 1 [Lindgomyces ingoldianus]KAF2474398.1 vacuolar amino acid transporter-like protein 1 [Lindgomyces ingoldianus]
MDIKGKQPSTWDEYDRGHRGSMDSTGTTGSRVQWDDDVERRLSQRSSVVGGGSPARHGEGHLRRRRSSMSMRINALRDAGGVNSLNNFARSWQRAAGFFEITPVRPSFRMEQGDERQDFPRSGLSAPDHRSLLRAAFETEGRRPSDNVIEDEEHGAPTEESLLLPSAVEHRLSAKRSHRDESIFSIEPSLASPFGGSYGTSYGSLAARVNESSMRHAGRLFTEQQMKGVTEPDQEREPLIVKQIEEDGQLINVVVGQSTLPQTIFNSVNVLVGVGLLSLPLALKYSGWVVGLIFLFFSAIATSYTAKLLAKCLDVDSSLITFADLAYVSFGNGARIAVSMLFTVELVATCVALVVLFADSMDDLISGWGVVAWKIVCGIILVPLGFLPLRALSFTSVLGIMCCFGIVIAVWADGVIKPHQPGSLREPATQYLFPSNWLTIPLSFGLLMSPWGGHSVFPNVYRDMRHPYKYRKGVNITYIITFLIDLGMACAGLLMFGDGVRDEITSNIFLTKGYPKALSVFIAICIAIIPLTKVPLNARPITSTLEILTGLDNRSLAASSSLNGMSGMNRGLLKFSLRILTTVVFVVIAIVFPSFDRIMTLLGSVACFTICLILPLAFHLKLFGKELGSGEWWMNWGMIVACSIMAVVSTVFAFFPKEMIGAA